MKVGKWVRLDNYFYCITSVKNGNFDALAQRKFTIYGGSNFDKIANTPRELVEIGDLVKYVVESDLKYYDNKHHEPYVEFEEILGTPHIKTVMKTDILEIWTKTSEDTYTRQWRKE